MKKYTSTYRLTTLLLLVMLALAWSCHQHDEVAESPNTGEPTGSTTVRFTVATGSTASSSASSQRRATVNDDPSLPATIAAFERERQINSLYAVLFRPDDDNQLKPGKWLKTIQVTNVTAVSGTDSKEYTCSFDAGALGVYFMYLVANPSTQLADKLMGTATVGALNATSTLDNFYALQENTVPMDNSADDFLMTSSRVRLDIDGRTGGLDVGDIHLTRAAVRIDIDASDVTGLVIENVTVNRLTQSELAHRESTAESDLGGFVNTTYRRTLLTPVLIGTDPLTSAPLYDVTDNHWQGVIYTYENPFNVETGKTAYEAVEAGATVVTVVARKGSEDLIAQVIFNAIPLRRNTLYDIHLSYDDQTAFGRLRYNIAIADWNEPESIAWVGGNLVNSKLPVFTVSKVSGTILSTWGEVSDGFGNMVNPQVVSIGDAETQLKLTVRTKVSAAELKYPEDKIEILNSSAITHDDATGELIQEFTLKVKSTTNLGTAAYDEIPVFIANVLDGEDVSVILLHGMKFKAELKEEDKTVPYKNANYTPEPTVTDYYSGATLTKGTDYTVTYANNKARGTATVTITGKNNYKNSIVETFEIGMGEGTITFASASRTVATGSTATYAVTKVGDGTVSYSSSNEAIATVTSAGKVTGKSAGTCTITAHVNDGTNYAYANKEASYTLTVTLKAGSLSFPLGTRAVMTGGTIASFPTHTGNSSITYSSSNTSVATVNSSGVVTGVSTGTTTITARVSDTSTYTYATKTVSYTVNVVSSGVAKANVTSQHRGWVLATDGYAYSNSSKVPSGKSASGVICYVGSSTGNSSYTHGLVMAMKDARTGNTNWSTAKSSGTSYSASRPSGTSGWALPTKTQLENMIGSSGMCNSTIFGNCFSVAGGTNMSGYYWTQTADPDDSSNAFEMSNGGSIISYQKSGGTYDSDNARSCFAF